MTEQIARIKEYSTADLQVIYLAFTRLPTTETGLFTSETEEKILAKLTELFGTKYYYNPQAHPPRTDENVEYAISTDFHGDGACISLETLEEWCATFRQDFPKATSTALVMECETENDDGYHRAKISKVYLSGCVEKPKTQYEEEHKAYLARKARKDIIDILQDLYGRLKDEKLKREKLQTTEYQEYLRLRAKFEGK